MTGSRPLKERLRNARSHSHASQRWLTRQLNDPLVRAARQEGYRARSVYKLKELDERFGLVKPGARVVDLGAAPGSWSQYAARKGAAVVASDLLEIEPLAGIAFVQGDFLAPAVQATLLVTLGGPADLVLSDIAANTTGQRTIDRLRAEGVGEAVLEFACRALGPGGACVLKLIRGAEAAVMPSAQAAFATARLVRPKATRQESSEVYLLARGFKGAAGAT